MLWNAGRLALTLLMIGTMTGALSAQSVEMVARVDPSQFSDTGAIPREGGPASLPALSADGRYAVFTSSAPNLVPGQKDLNHSSDDPGSDVFLKDFVTGALTLVSHSMSAPTTAGNGRSWEAVISADGRYVAFLSNATDLAPGQRELAEPSRRPRPVSSALSATRPARRHSPCRSARTGR